MRAKKNLQVIERIAVRGIGEVPTTQRHQGLHVPRPWVPTPRLSGQGQFPKQLQLGVGGAAS